MKKISSLILPFQLCLFFITINKYNAYSQNASNTCIRYYCTNPDYSIRFDMIIDLNFVDSSVKIYKTISNKIGLSGSILSANFIKNRNIALLYNKNSVSYDSLDSLNINTILDTIFFLQDKNVGQEYPNGLVFNSIQFIRFPQKKPKGVIYIESLELSKKNRLFISPEFEKYVENQYKISFCGNLNQYQTIKNKYRARKTFGKDWLDFIIRDLDIFALKWELQNIIKK